MKNKLFGFGVFLLIVLICSPLVVFVYWTWIIPVNIQNPVYYDAFGTYGDFFGGVIGTIIAVVGVVFVYRTYENQNRTLKNQIIFQKKDQIESRFFELLKLHERNVEELKGLDRNIFNIYIQNIRSFVENFKKYKNQKGKAWEDKDVVKLGYLYFFFGTSENTPDRLADIPIDATEIKELNDFLTQSGIVYKGAFADLGKYFRQLFQIVTYIDEKPELTYAEKKQYIKTLRVRLNIEEQYLLFLNSIVSIGLVWEINQTDENKQFITKYNLIKNIPQKFNPIGGIDCRTVYSNVHYEDYGSNKSTERRRLENLYKRQ